MCETVLQNKVSGGGGSSIPEQIPLQPVVRAVVSQAVPLKPMKVHGGAGIHLRPMGDPILEPRGGCELWEIYTAAGSWQDLWAMEKEAHIRAGLLTGLATLQETHTGAVLPEGLHPLKGIHTGAV